MQGPEPVRLVIWDLDETLWYGTLTEGGIRYRRDVHDIVVELARRGIVSSICSKNDLAPVRDILAREGLWGYVVFPSVDWTPKGPRIQALIEAIQLRPQTVLLIDDNPMNLAEAEYYSPGLQTANDTLIATLLDDPRCQGKDDLSLTRLSQYRLLQTRQTAVQSAAGDAAAFLRDSGIKITIEHDLEPHLDRVVELINRTNQLNFCKDRLPENQEEARTALRALLAPHMAQAGIVRVRDRYGDYGYCGFYLVWRQHTSPRRLLQFCFSCRILGMKIETWLYRLLDRPKLRIVGDVISDPVGDTSEIDWIEQERVGETSQTAASPHFDHVLMRGGCDVQPLAHYLTLLTRRFVGEFQVTRNRQIPTISHSIMLRHALNGISPEACEAAEPFGYIKEDFQSHVTQTHAGEGGLWVFSFAQDSGTSLYRYKPTGELLPVHFERVPQPARNLVDRPIDEAQVPAAIIGHLRRWFDYSGPIADTLFSENVRMVLDRAPPGVRVVLLLNNELAAGARGKPVLAPGIIKRNRLISDAAAGYANVELVKISDYDAPGAEPTVGHHFERMVHFRMFEDIVRRAGDQRQVSAAQLPIRAEA